jgi:hypothetical protein
VCLSSQALSCRAATRARRSGVKKRKVQLTFKQKRRKAGMVKKAVARTERETSKRHSAGHRKESKNALKKLW